MDAALATIYVENRAICGQPRWRRPMTWNVSRNHNSTRNLTYLIQITTKIKSDIWCSMRHLSAKFCTFYPALLNSNSLATSADLANYALYW